MMPPLLLLCLLACAPGAKAEAHTSITRSIDGTVVLPDPLTLPADAAVVLRSAGEKRQRTSFPKPDGTFAFRSVPAGVYHVEVNAAGLLFPMVKVEVSGSGVQAQLPEVPGMPTAVHPLRMAPMAMLHPFEKRQGFDVVAWLKTPYGLMFAFMVVSLVVMPALKVDPEEYQQMVEERQRLSQHVTGGEGRQAGRREVGGGPRR